jgi:hypothetical protein
VTAARIQKQLDTIVYHPATLTAWKRVFTAYAKSRGCSVCHIVEGNATDKVKGILYVLDKDSFNQIQKSEGVNAANDGQYIQISIPFSNFRVVGIDHGHSEVYTFVVNDHRPDYKLFHCPTQHYVIEVARTLFEHDKTKPVITFPILSFQNNTWKTKTTVDVNLATDDDWTWKYVCSSRGSSRVVKVQNETYSVTKGTEETKHVYASVPNDTSPVKLVDYRTNVSNLGAVQKEMFNAKTQKWQVT